MKRAAKEAAIMLRKSGESLPIIAKKLGVSKSSVSLWMRGEEIPEWVHDVMKKRADANRRRASEARRQKTRNMLRAAELEAGGLAARTVLDAATARALCALMYWCEGSKSTHDSQFTFTNADPLTIAGFIGLFRTAFVLDERRFRVRMHLHEYHDEPRQRAFWSAITGVPETQFTKTYWKPHTGISKKPNYPGCIHLRYYDVTVARKISATARAFLRRMV